MKNWNSEMFSLCLLLLMFNGTQGAKKCPDGQFGSKCEYDCHCAIGSCDSKTDECGPDGCDSTHFGPKCQYVNAAYSNASVFTDGNDSTCLTGEGDNEIIKLSEPLLITWIRIKTSIPGLIPSFVMQFWELEKGLVQPSEPLKMHYADATTIDIHGRFSALINQIVVKFSMKEARRFFCSIYVSLGRLLALRQSTKLSSVGKYHGEKSVDGDRSQVRGTCAETGLEKKGAWWRLTLPFPSKVWKYEILNTVDREAKCRLSYFEIKASNGDKLVFNGTSQGPNFKEYTYVDFAQEPITQVTINTTKQMWPGEKVLCGLGFIALTLCEVALKGDVACPQRKWGLECENNCLADCDFCYPGTGLCSSGCKPGFRGAFCDEICEYGMYGKDCKKMCSCGADKGCNSVSGECGAKYEVHCVEEECEPGFYGASCDVPCSEACGGDGTCNMNTGSCNHGCRPNFKDEACGDIVCGDECTVESVECSLNCAESNDTYDVCDPENGQCLHGCKPGFTGLRCNKPLQPGMQGEDGQVHREDGQVQGKEHTINAYESKVVTPNIFVALPVFLAIIVIVEIVIVVTIVRSEEEGRKDFA